MSRFLRVFAIIFSLFFVGNAFAAGYVCNDIKRYTSCNTGYYMATSASNSTYNGTAAVGNACLPCPSNATFCPGGTAAPLYKVTLNFNGGENPSGSSSNAATTTVYAGADDKWYIGTTSTSAGTLISSTNPVKTPRRNGYYFDGYNYGSVEGSEIVQQDGTIAYGSNLGPTAPITLVAEWVKCPANSYCDTTVENNGVHTCPSTYSKSNAGASSEFDCYVTCIVGTRVASPGDSCRTVDGGWATLAHNVNYGSVSALYMPTYPFINNTSTVTMYHNANMFGNASLMAKFSGEGEPGYKLIGNIGAQANNGFPIYKVRFTNAGDDGEWQDIVLKELVVLREEATVNASSTSPTYGIYDADASAIYEQTGTFYISDGYIDITRGGAATDGDSSTYVSMPGGSYLVYSLGSDPIEISRIQVELGFNDDMSEFKIEVDISGNNDWVSITGNGTHDGYNQIDTSAVEGTYGEPVSRTLIFPVAAMQPCGNGNYKGTSSTTWNNFAQLTSCDSCADIANTNGFYQYTDTTTAGSGAQCFGTTTAGNFVEEMSKGEISCKQGYYCPGGSNVYYGNIGKPTTGGSNLCPAGSYCPASTSTPSACPDNYTSVQGAGNTSHCYIMCSPGQRVKTPGGTCITDTGAWYTAANKVFYGMLSPALYAPYPFITNNYTDEGAHNFYTPDNIDASTGTAPAGQFALGADGATAKMGNINSSAVRVTNKGATAILYEISVFSPSESITPDGYHAAYNSIIKDIIPAALSGVNTTVLSRLTDTNTPDTMTTQRRPYTSDEIGVVFNTNGKVTYQFTTQDVGAVQIVTHSAPELLVEVYSTELQKWVTIYDTSEHPTGSKPIIADTVNTMILPATAWEPCSTGKYKPALSTSPIPWASITSYQTCNSCSELDGTNGFYSQTSSTGSSAATQCFGTTTAGSAVTTANKAEAKCGLNTACPGGTNVFYGSTGGSETCPVDTYSPSGATTCSACPAYTNQLGEYGIIKSPAAGCVYALVFGNSSAENNAVLENFSSQTFNSAAIQLNPDYDANSEYNKSGVHVIIRTFNTENPTAERWSIAQNYGCNAGYYRPNATSIGALGGSLNLEELTAKFCQPAEKGYWSPGITNTTWGNMTLENMGVLRNACPAGYDDGSATAGAENQCVLTTTAGKYVKTPNANEEICAGDGYCIGGINVYYGSTGGYEACDTNYRANTSTGKTAATQCQTSCEPGTAVLSANAACATVTGNRYKTGTALVNYGSTSPTATDVTSNWNAGTVYSCLSNYTISGTAASNHDARTDCTISCDPGTQIASANATSCTTPTGTTWYTDTTHSVPAGSSSGSNVKTCNTSYATANTATATDHDNANDCKTTCAPGTWVASAGAACGDVGNGYYTTTSQTISQGSIGSRSQCSALNAFYTNSDNGRNAAADCYGYATATKYVAEAGKGAVTCSGGYCPGDNTTKIYYASGNGATTGGRSTLSNWTCPSGADAASDCYRGVTLNKNSMSGTLTLPSSSGCRSIGGATGTTSDTVYVYYNTACKLPTTALSATATGTTYTGTGTWATSSTASSGFVNSITLTDTSSTTPVRYAGKMYTCSAGYHLPANGTACSACVAGNWCAGISNKYYSTSAQGLSSCSGNLGTGYTSAGGTGDTANTKCYLPVSAGYIRSGTSGTTTAACDAGKYKTAHDAYYGSSYSCSNVNAGYWNNGGGTNATGGVISGKSGGTIAAGRWGAAGATSDQGSGAVNAGYYSTGGGTSATPTAAGNGCLSSKACGKVTAGCYADTTGSTTACPNTCPGLYVNSAAGSDSINDCYFTTKAGKYIADKTDTAQKDCEAAYYCPSATLYYPNAGNRLDCPAYTNRLIAVADYPENYYDATFRSAYNITWGTNKSAITQCRVSYSFYNSRGNFVDTLNYNTDTGKYDTSTGTTLYYSSVNPGYYLKTKYSETYCNVSEGSTNRMYYREALPCPENSYCEGYATLPLCTSGDYNDTLGVTACSTLGNGYDYSAGGTSATSSAACYLTLGTGKFVETAGADQKTCTAGGYCDKSGSKIYYGSTGGRTACSAGTYNANTGSTTSSACSACVLGSYSSGTGNTSCTACQSGTTTSGTGKTTCDATCSNNNNYDNAWETASWSANTMTNLCKIKNCKAGSAYASANSGSCTACGTGTYMSSSAHTNTTCTSAGSGYYVDTTGATSRKACSALDSSKTDGTYTSVSPYNANTTCRFTQNQQTIPTYCKTKTSNTMSYTGSAWPANTYSVTAEAGSIISGNNTASAKCGQCSPGTYQGTDGSTATSCTPASKGYYVESTGASSQTQCSAGTYTDTTGKSSCSTITNGCYGAAGATSACPNNCNALTPAVAVTGGTYSSVTPRSTNTTCRYVAPAKTANGCSTVTANTVSYSGSAWTSNYYTAKASKGYRVSATSTSAPACTICSAGTYQGTDDSTATSCTNAADGKYVAGTGATTDVACAQGSYSEKSSASTKCIACPAGRTTSGTGTKYNATANTACSVTCSNAGGAYSWADPSWSANSVANLCTLNTCSSSYYKNGNACTLCSTLADGFYPNSDNGNSSGTSACRTNTLSGKYVASKNATSATNCANWTYKGSHAVNYGSTSSCTDCAATPSALSGVSWTKASGTGWDSYSDCVVTQTPANCASGTTSRTQTNATTWGDITLVSTLKSKDGYFASTTAKACSAAGDGYYAKAGATGQTACALGSYSEKSSASTKCIACPKGRTTSGTGTKYNATANTACSVTCSNAGGVYSWADPSWSANSVANLCTVSACNADTYYTAKTATGYKNTCTACGANSGNDANHTMSKCICDLGHTIDGKLGSSNTSTSGCTRISGIACGVGQYLPAQATTCEDCDAGYYCPAEPKDYSFQDDIQGRVECALGTYQPNKKQTSCLVADAGYYVPKTAQTQQTACTGATYQDATGQSSCKSCPTATNETAVKYGYWNTSSAAGDHTIRNGCYAEFTNKSLDDGSMSLYRCYVDTKANSNDPDTYGINGNTKGCWVYAEGLKCNAGYYNDYFNKNGTDSSKHDFSYKTLTDMYANVCRPVESGYWSAADVLTRTACPSGYVNGSATASAENQCAITVTGGHYISSAGQNSSNWGTCGNWKYKGEHTLNYGQTSSCSDCPSVPSATDGVAWTKKSGTGWTNWNQCVVTQTPANCASGSTKRTASSASAWGNITKDVTLKSKAGYYAATDAIKCTAASAGYFATAGATSQTACVKGSYTDKTAQSACIACGSEESIVTETNDDGEEVNISTWGLTTTGSGQTSCNATCANATGAKGWTPSTWNSNNTVSDLCTINSCQGNTKNGTGDGHYFDADNNACKLCSSFANGLYPHSSTGGVTKGREACFLYTSEIPGHYIKEVGDEMATPCPRATFSAGNEEQVVHYGTEKSTCDYCSGNTYADEEGLTECKACPAGYTTYYGGDDYDGDGINGDGRSDIRSCRIVCPAGSYLAKAGDSECTPVGAGYWTGATQSPYIAYGSTSARNQCPSGQTTIGYGSGADEAGDCGRILHVGDGKLYLRSDKKTTPALNVKIGNTTFFGNMTDAEDKYMSDGVQKHLRIKDNDGTEYTVYDDSGDNYVGGGTGGGSSITLNPNNTATSVEPASYNVADGLDWSVTMGDGTTLTGIGACDSTVTSGAMGDIASTNFTPNGSGSSCWCKITSPNQTSKWVLATANAGTSCSTKCSFQCTGGFTGTKAKHITFRTNLYNLSGISTQ